MSVSEKKAAIPAPIQMTPLADVPAVQPGDDLAELLHAAAKSAGVALSEGVLVVCQKIVSNNCPVE